jgi:hypothetical protein
MKARKINMYKAVIQYTDCLGDKRTVNYYLTRNNVKIVKTRKGMSIYPKITIIVGSIKELNEIVSILNNESQYGVSVVKTRKMFNLFGVFI